MKFHGLQHVTCYKNHKGNTLLIIEIFTNEDCEIFEVEAAKEVLYLALRLQSLQRE